MLTLPIKRKWFDMICKGQKREESRADCPTAKLWVHCIYGKGGAREWGADPEKNYFVLQILHVEKIDNWKWRD